ncbi:CheR family methyltransferase [Crateriforma conspicua]|uniref:protein-glutamate O-methyltransferase n=1 Tax=Crateriforma conspicua TaxID=2527996 RepID=A0A5C5Y9S0_9PLAN|nr:protein-glutamate O-methyltransferase CheR [Crateriforma conspicua]QDV61319.1 Chemotaxis protein methyltransferase Cher2 [Crateriforma conspicua]TWT72427.1 Chemotaxis protein methyltransferase Cher2 [Crateriforma conspicua]
MQATVERHQLDRVRGLAKQLCGIHLDGSKDYLIRRRLNELMVDEKIDNLQDLLALAEAPYNRKIRERMVDALTTHETLFFRDKSPFDALTQHIIPKLYREAVGRPRLRIWSAACSTGQEPYSLAIACLESLPERSRWDIRIDASDVSVGTVEAAKRGRFQNFELSRGLSPQQQSRYFRREGNDYRIVDEVRGMVNFQVNNLLTSTPPGHDYDVIMCRNVAIYFTPADRRRIYQKMASALRPQGSLFLGCSEVPTNVSDLFKTVPLGRATSYQRIG